VSRRAKLIAKMKATPGKIRFAEAEALLRHFGFAVVNKRGSHQTFSHEDGPLVTLVKPHGGRKTCHPADIARLLEALDL
jgi:predicted RNA binding protein YcfA (HicA-like mRNA interferase family)